MKKLFVLSVSMMIFGVITSCDNKSTFQTIVEKVKAGEIPFDTLGYYVGDSSYHEQILEWSHMHSTDDVAAFILGTAYEFGAFGVKRNIAESKEYYSISANSGNGYAMLRLGSMYADYPEYEDLDSALYWVAKAVSKGRAKAYASLARVEERMSSYSNTPIDSARLVEIWREGVTHNDTECRAQLAHSYYYGYGVDADKKTAYNLLKNEDKDNLNSLSLAMLGIIYEEGEVVQQNFEKSFEYYKESADKGNIYAMCKLGNFYEWGSGVEKNDSLAFLQYQSAANHGSPWGQRCVANCYRYGTGVDEDMDNAYQWYRTAAKNGDEIAVRYCKENNIEY